MGATEGTAMIKQVQASYNPAQLEKTVREFWTKTNCYKLTKELRSSGPDYYFVDGPPYTTGYIHLGTAWNKTIKDTIIRFKRMQKFNVTDTPGYDMHGLPIEVKVEQSIGVKNKKEIEEYGIDRFVGTCKDFALGFQKKMNEQFAELGVWMDWENPYLTINSSYIEAAWWTLKRAHDKGLLVTANRVLPGCPRCETALAEAEIEYSNEKDPSIYVKFPLRNDEKVSLLIWTTTPWTLPANMAVAAHPDFKYARVRYRRIGETETVIVLKDLIEQIARSADGRNTTSWRPSRATTWWGQNTCHRSVTRYLPEERGRQVGAQGHSVKDRRGIQHRFGAHCAWPRS